LGTKDFPSWSWASLKIDTLFSKPKPRSSNLQIEVSLADGLWLDVDAYGLFQKVDSDIGLSKLIPVIGYITRPKFVDLDWIRHNLVNANTAPTGLCAIMRCPDSGTGFMA
jgi:hypothetical protein